MAEPDTGKEGKSKTKPPTVHPPGIFLDPTDEYGITRIFL